MISINRRQLFEAGGLMLGGGLFLKSPLALGMKPNTATGPKYLLQVHYDLGLSQCVMFDARPSIFTANGVFHNHLLEPSNNANNDPLAAFRGKDAIAYPASMGKGYYSPILESFMNKHGKDIAIVNGVHMAGTDGHQQNTQSFLTGFQDRANLFLDFKKHPSKQSNSTYSALLLRSANINVADESKYLVTSSGSLRPLLDTFAEEAPNIRFNQEHEADLKVEFDKMLGLAKGSLFKGVSGLYASRKAGDEMLEKLRENAKTRKGGGNLSEFELTLSALSDCFTIGLTNHAVLQLSMQTDSHDAGAQRQKLQTIANIASQLESLVSFLKKTDAPDRSGKLFDQTVVMIAGEFDRTTRNQGMQGNIFNHGSDHNWLNNSILVFGGGIKGGQVIGESDLDVIPKEFEIARNDPSFGTLREEVIRAVNNLSRKNYPEHKATDESIRMAIGKPWDFAAEGGLGKVRESYNQRINRVDYITIQSIQNTILTHFGYRDASHIQVSRDSIEKAKLLPRLLRA